MHLAGFCTGTALDFSCILAGVHWNLPMPLKSFEYLQYVVTGELAFLLTNFSLHLVIPRMRAFRVHITWSICL